jgi:hypothetical protein
VLAFAGRVCEPRDLIYAMTRQYDVITPRESRQRDNQVRVTSRGQAVSVRLGTDLAGVLRWGCR